MAMHVFAYNPLLLLIYAVQSVYQAVNTEGASGVGDIEENHLISMDTYSATGNIQANLDVPSSLHLEQNYIS